DIYAGATRTARGRSPASSPGLSRSADRRSQAAERDDLLPWDPPAPQMVDVQLRLLERGDHEAVQRRAYQLGHRSDGECEEVAPAVAGEDADRLEPRLFEREIGQFGSLPGAVEGAAFDGVPRQGAERLAHRLAGARGRVSRGGPV